MPGFTIVISTNNPVAEAKVRYWAEQIAQNGEINYDAATDTNHDTVIEAYTGTPMEGERIYEHEYDSADGNRA